VRLLSAGLRRVGCAGALHFIRGEGAHSGGMKMGGGQTGAKSQESMERVQRVATGRRVGF
jgi:hypothetical protein